jgi:hypothetical protein
MINDLSVFERTVADLSKVPDIRGAWECTSRRMRERSPGDAVKGIVEVNPPDPKAPGGRMIIKIVQDGRTYTSEDLVNARHDHKTKGFYIGNDTFAFTTTRTAQDGNRARRILTSALSKVGLSFNKPARQMTLNGTAALIDDNTLRVTLVGAEGGKSAPHPDNDPPPTFAEERIYTRKRAMLADSARVP